MRVTCCLAVLLLLPLNALADEAPGETEATTEEATGEPEEGSPDAAEKSSDPLTARMEALVRRYYEGIDTPPSDDEIRRGVESIQMMLLAGVSLRAVEQAVHSALRLHNPGRRIFFEVAVPLRVRSAPDDPKAVEEGTEAPPPLVLPSPRAEDPELDERRRAARAAEEARRGRYRLYSQWRERTRVKRSLFSAGIPILATGYVTGYAAAGISLLVGTGITHQEAWLTAIPVFGPAILDAVSGGELPGFSVISLVQGAGAALIIIGAAIKVDFPYERDPTALRLGRKRSGEVALELRVVPTAGGAGLIGRF
ncbi:MAG: hypothetical protein VX498_06435 [Myxococcota bacterium]|nr:hypothetical protein [Myxococcota bacterium]